MTKHGYQATRQPSHIALLPTMVTQSMQHRTPAFASLLSRRQAWSQALVVSPASRRVNRCCKEKQARQSEQMLISPCTHAYPHLRQARTTNLAMQMIRVYTTHRAQWPLICQRQQVLLHWMRPPYHAILLLCQAPLTTPVSAPSRLRHHQAAVQAVVQTAVQAAAPAAVLLQAPYQLLGASFSSETTGNQLLSHTHSEGFISLL